MQFSAGISPRCRSEDTSYAALRDFREGERLVQADFSAPSMTWLYA
jgi:hypothetical protein